MYVCVFVIGYRIQGCPLSLPRSMDGMDAPFVILHLPCHRCVFTRVRRRYLFPGFLPVFDYTRTLFSGALAEQQKRGPNAGAAHSIFFLLSFFFFLSSPQTASMST